MKNFSKKIVIVSLFLSSISFSGISQFLNDAIIELENPKAIETQERHYYWGGGIRLRTPNMNVTPLILRAPRIDAGCAGLDIVFGGFSFLNFEYLVQFLERTLQAAPAFAFSMALNALCDSCESILNKLNALANQINSMNLNSCQAAQFIGSKIGQWAGSILMEDVQAGKDDSWLNAIKGKLGSFNSLLSSWLQNLGISGCSNEDCIIKTIFDPNDKTSTFIKKTLRNTYFSNSEYVYIARALFGDLKIFKPQNSDDEHGFVVKAYSPTIQYGSIRNFVKNMIYGTETGENSCKNTTFQFTSFEIDSNGRETRGNYTSDTFCGVVNSRLTSIAHKLKNRIPLSDNEKAFLAAFRVPAYRILNVTSIEPALFDAIMNDLIKLLGAELAYTFLSELAKEINRPLSVILADNESQKILDKEVVKEMKQNINMALQETYRYVVDEYNNFNNKIRALNEWKRLEARILATYASHPIVGAYMFSKILPSF